MIELNKIYNEDCLEGMKRIPDNSIDCIICDLPYGTTSCKWDKIIPFDKLWEQYNRIIKKNRAIILFSSGSFSYKVISSMPELYRYKWIWFKNNKGNFINAKNRPMTSYEEIMVFSKGCTANGSKNKMIYNPQGLIKKERIRIDKSGTRFGSMAGKRPSQRQKIISQYTNFPFDVLQFKCEKNPIHQTQKPVELIEYLIKTYSNEGETILDNCMGSGTTAIACINTKRNYIGFEIDKEYYDISMERLSEHQPKLL